MASKINPILFRLNIQKKNDWYNNINHNKNISVINWNKYLNSAIIERYKQSLKSKKRIWSSSWGRIPKDKIYSSYFHLNFKIQHLIKLAFFKINFFVYDLNVEFKSTKDSDLKINFFIYPITNQFKLVDIEIIRLKLIKWFQIYSGLRVKINIFNSYSFIKLNKDYLLNRSEIAKKIRPIFFNSKNLEKEEWFFEIINCIYLLKNAELLNNLIAFDLSICGKKHIQSLSFFEKILKLFWNLEQANQIRFQNLTIFQQRCLTIKLKGIKIQIKGRLNGQDRKQKISFNIGCLSLQDLNTFVDYSENKILTRYGVLGLKIWITFSDSQNLNQRNSKLTKSSKKNIKNLLFEIPWIN